MTPTVTAEAEPQAPQRSRLLDAAMWTGIVACGTAALAILYGATANESGTQESLKNKQGYKDVQTHPATGLGRWCQGELKNSFHATVFTAKLDGKPVVRVACFDLFGSNDSMRVHDATARAIQGYQFP